MEQDQLFLQTMLTQKAKTRSLYDPPIMWTFTKSFKEQSPPLHVYLEAYFSGEDGECAEVNSCVSAAALLQLQLGSLETGSGLASVEFNNTLVAYR